MPPLPSVKKLILLLPKRLPTFSVLMKYPLMSIRRSVALLASTSIPPSDPLTTMDVFATTPPAVALRMDVPGYEALSGQAARKLSAPGGSTVKFREYAGRWERRT